MNNEQNTEARRYEGREASELSGLLKGISLEKDDHFHNYQFRLPNGATRKATMTDVLLWETLTYLHELNDRWDDRAVRVVANQGCPCCGFSREPR